jgi:multisubunit Na+/H+ antiporter MnhF subunit
MRGWEFAVALILAVIVFAALELIGMIVKFALIAAVIGFIAGLVLARSFRRA